MKIHDSNLIWTFCSIGCLIQLYSVSHQFINFRVRNEVAFDYPPRVELPAIDIMIPMAIAINMTELFKRHPYQVISLCRFLQFNQSIIITADNLNEKCPQLSEAPVIISNHLANILTVEDIEYLTKGMDKMINGLILTETGSELIVEKRCKVDQFFTSTAIYLRIACQNQSNPFTIDARKYLINGNHFAILVHSLGSYFGIRFTSPKSPCEISQNRYFMVIQETGTIVMTTVRYKKTVSDSLRWPYETSCQNYNKPSALWKCILTRSTKRKTDPYIPNNVLVEYQKYPGHLTFSNKNEEMTQCANVIDRPECETIVYETEGNVNQEKFVYDGGYIYLEAPLDPTVYYKTYPAFPVSDYIIFVGSILGIWFGVSISERLSKGIKLSTTKTTRIHIDPIVLLDYSYHGVTDRFLASASKWSFNSFTLDTLTGGHSLSALLFHLFNKYNFIQEFKLEIINVWKCLRLFENGYHDTNPYHNSIHAADVTQAMHCFIEEEKIGQYLTPMEKMCSLLAAVTHDLDHPGVNQHFLIATKSHLASLYNVKSSVLESHHWRFAISCLKESGIFSHFNSDQWSTVQFLLRSLILATDVTQQTNYLKRFRESLESATISMATPTDRLFVMQIALKCADLGNPCRPWVLSKKWTAQICDEFYRQGDYEKQLNMQVTPIFDRRTASVARIQIDFYRNIVSPLFQLWDQFLCSKLSRRMMFNLKFNDSQWTNSLEKVNVKRRHSYETMNEKKRKAKDISKSLDDIMLIEEISLDELKEIPKGFCLEDKVSSSSTSSPSSSSSGRPRPEGHRKYSTDDSVDQSDDHFNQHHHYRGDDNNHGNQDDDYDDGERMHIGKKQCIGPNGCGTPSPPSEKRCSLPIISMTDPKLGSTLLSTTSSSTSSLTTITTTAAKSLSSNFSPAKVFQSHQLSSSTPTKQTTNCSSSSHSHSHHHHHSRHSRHHHHHHHHPHHHHHHHPHHRHSSLKQQSATTTTTTQPPLPYISVPEPITQTDCTYIGEGGIDHDAGDDGGLSDNSLFSTYSGLPRVVEQLMNYEQSIDKVTCLPHSFSALPPGYSTSSSTITPSYPSQSIVDTAQYMRGRRGSAPGCIGIYTGCELAAATLVFLHGTVSENDDNSLITSSHHPHQYNNNNNNNNNNNHINHPSLSSSHFHPSHSSSSLVHLKCHSSSSMNPSPTSSSQSSPSSSPPHSSYSHHHHQHQQQQQQQSSPTSTTKQHQRPSLFLTKSNNNNHENNNKGQKRRSSFPVCDSGHYLSYLATEGGSTIGVGVGIGGGGKLTNRKSPSSYFHGTAKSSSPRLKGRSLELLMSSLTAKTKLLTNHQSCSLDSASECRSWLVKREERRGSIPQDILIHSLANYTSANAL
ncbi:uncharacterized protein LOC128393950 [Panonychus citri]|uniref:uncharacterized protein LOC128393950 n=1 Tax=Panonychus citri TaxID=50023 RepID=UPI0023072E0E|nr:uncharacterized protein LOC128393950 [Panonychus citri]